MMKHQQIIQLIEKTRGNGKPMLLDLFCGGGGAGVGYEQAGFSVVGVDIEPQPYYPMPFIQFDALEFMQQYGAMFDAIHASPPCQGYSSITKTAGTQDDHERLIPVTRRLLQQARKLYVIENVPGAKNELDNPLMLCGTMFGLNVIRHRYFEMSDPIYFVPYTCAHAKKVVKCGRVPDPDKHYAAPVGHFSGVEFAQQSMGIDWLGRDGLRKAIPPAYTKYIGRHLMNSMSF